MANEQKINYKNNLKVILYTIRFLLSIQINVFLLNWKIINELQ